MDNLIERAEDLASRCIPPAAGIIREMIERIRLADAIAYNAARSDIECGCFFYGEPGAWVYDPSTCEPDAKDMVHRAIAYLESRGLIERDEHGFIRVLRAKDT